MIGNMLSAALALSVAVAPVAAAPSQAVARSKTPSGFANMVYYTDWSIYARNFKPAQLPADKLTHVLYAFLNVDADGVVFSGDEWADIQQTYPATDANTTAGNNLFGCAKQIYLLKKQNRRLKSLLSIGGWTWSTNFSTVAASPAKRKTFAQSSVKIMADWGFDGIDIDWEYPESVTDAANFNLLVKDVRTELDAYAANYTPSYHYQLTMAASAGPLKYGNLSFPFLGETLDYINLMAYDYGGSWENSSSYLANVYGSDSNPATPFNTEQAIEAYIGGGVPAAKMVLGMPVYGRSFDNTSGMGKPYSGVGTGTWEAGVWDYKALPHAGATYYYDKKLIAGYAYNNQTRELVSYDTPEVVKAKVQYIKNKGLGGSMFWEASADKLGSESLITTAFTSQGGKGKEDCTLNQLNYPASQYANLRAGMP
ncbi:hypothetical protein TD95_003582 [Thielaviopsis punctulata]|uniref:chitinase n=1 Tax=Thielaviopsis punctulata TaxID=72032 RepID=A0A0F4ZHF9_9PEZI|nr:hypothetical protein TD95_003582 [Thielaviopsis punctulata]